MGSKWIAPLIAALATGCVGAVDEDNYAYKYSPLYCSKTKECFRGLYDSEWADMNDCVETVRDDVEDLIDDMSDAGCDFEPKEAKECITDLSASSCEEYYEGDAFADCGLNKIWDC